MSWVKWAVIGVVATAGITVGIIFLTQSDSKAEESNAVEEQNSIEGFGIRSTRVQMDLNDFSFVERLETDGLKISVDETHHMSVEENLTTGYQWIIKPTCEFEIQIQESYDPPFFAEDEGIVGAAGTKYIQLLGANEGECTYQMAYARSWEFDWDSNANAAARMITFDIEVQGQPSA